MSEIIDISPLISEEIAVWPGDTPFSQIPLCSIADGANIDLSGLKSTVHLGAHADAPSHYIGSGETIDGITLDPYIGHCIVVTVSTGKIVSKNDCLEAVKRGAKRILFKTGSYKDPCSFNKDFGFFSPDAVAFMGEKGVTLVGIDTPSVDPFESKDLPAHAMLAKYNMRNLEGLILEHVPDGEYELVALPLKLRGFDASPVRAILRKLT